MPNGVHIKEIVKIQFITQNNMYKSFKLTKRYGIAFERFRKAAKTMKLRKTVYHTGIYKTTDDINEFDTYYFVLGRCRIMWYVQHKHKCGHSAG